MNLTTIMAIIMVSVLIISVFFKKLPMQFTLCILPIICALCLGFPVNEISDFVINQTNKTMQASGYMCLFALMYFTMLSETGMFKILIEKSTGLAKGHMNLYLVMIMTSLIAAIGMLTATVVTAYMIVFPIMLPLYNKLKFDKKAAMIIAQTSIAAMCFVPWGVAVVNSSVFAGVDAIELSRNLMPVALCFIPVIILQWIYFGFLHKKQGGIMKIELTEKLGMSQEVEGDSFERPKLFWINLILFLIVISVLAFTKVPAYMIFMMASFITILLNYPKPKEYQQLLNKSGKTFFNTFFMLVGISFFMGVFQETGMVNALSTLLVDSFPEFLTRYIYIILAVLMIVIIRFLPNKIYTSTYPVLISLGSKFGLSGVNVISPFVCNMTLATGSSPFTPATHVGTALLDIDTEEYCNYAVPIQTVGNILIIVLAMLFGFVK